MAAVIGGAESWYEVADFGKMHESFFRSRIKDFKCVPSHDNVSLLMTLSIVYFPFFLPVNSKMAFVSGYVRFAANTVVLYP